MIAGYLHLGPAESGPTRYGRLIARFVEKHADWKTYDFAVDTPSLRPEFRDLREGARALDNADIVHVQYAPKIWGGRLRQIRSAHLLTRRISPPVIVTIHDAVEPVPPSTGCAVRILARRASCLIVASQIERKRLQNLGVPTSIIEVVPHFVEPRKALISRNRAKEALGFSGRRMVTVLGFVHRRKGHDIALAALKGMRDDTLLVFAGGSVRGGNAFMTGLVEEADRMGLAHRLRITGYLDDAELDTYLSATDVGLLPFRDAAASGSLSTWLAVGCPLVGSDIPLLREYRGSAPALIRLVSNDPESLATAVEAVEQTDEVADEAESLAERYSPSNTARRLSRIYRGHVRGR